MSAVLTAVASPAQATPDPCEGPITRVVLLSNGDDVFYGDDTSEEIHGRGGNDIIYGLDGADRLIGGAGNDTLVGSQCADVLEGNANYDLLAGGTGADVFDGGAGADQCSDGVEYPEITYLYDFSPC
jgi:Ca2+-binding RTX toxin-like protein